MDEAADEPMTGALAIGKANDWRVRRSRGVIEGDLPSRLARQLVVLIVVELNNSQKSHPPPSG
jgi:hypothetical protein